MTGRVRVRKASAQLVINGLRNGVSGSSSGVATSGVGDSVIEGVEEDEVDAKGCRR